MRKHITDRFRRSAKRRGATEPGNDPGSDARAGRTELPTPALRVGDHDVHPPSAPAAIASIDAVLDLVARRDFLTRDEAVSLLLSVRKEAGGTTTGGPAAVLDEAIVAFGSDAIIDRRRVVDPLLDARSLLAREVAALIGTAERR